MMGDGVIDLKAIRGRSKLQERSTGGSEIAFRWQLVK